MSSRVIITCDGCGDERVRNASVGTDWKQVTISLSGFKGYPTCASMDPDESEYDLCPQCARRLWLEARPLSWARATPASHPSKGGGTEQ